MNSQSVRFVGADDFISNQRLFTVIIPSLLLVFLCICPFFLIQTFSTAILNQKMLDTAKLAIEIERLSNIISHSTPFTPIDNSDQPDICLVPHAVSIRDRVAQFVQRWFLRFDLPFKSDILPTPYQNLFVLTDEDDNAYQLVHFVLGPRKRNNNVFSEYIPLQPLEEAISCPDGVFLKSRHSKGRILVICAHNLGLLRKIIPQSRQSTQENDPSLLAHARFPIQNNVEIAIEESLQIDSSEFVAELVDHNGNLLRKDINRYRYAVMKRLLEGVFLNRCQIHLRVSIRDFSLFMTPHHMIDDHIRVFFVVCFILFSLSIVFSVGTFISLQNNKNLFHRFLQSLITYLRSLLITTVTEKDSVVREKHRKDLYQQIVGKSEAKIARRRSYFVVEGSSESPSSGTSKTELDQLESPVSPEPLSRQSFARKSLVYVGSLLRGKVEEPKGKEKKESPKQMVSPSSEFDTRVFVDTAPKEVTQDILVSTIDAYPEDIILPSKELFIDSFSFGESATDSPVHRVQIFDFLSVLATTIRLFLPPPVSNFLVFNPKELHKELNTCSTVVLFFDIQDSTRISEELSDISFERYLNLFYEETIGIIEEKGGIVDKLLGDCIMCFWVSRTPHDTRQACLSAVQTIVKIQRKIESREFQKNLDEAGLPKYRLKYGLHVGDSLVGIVGTRHMSYTTLGDTVNTAARLEKANEIYNTQVLLSGDIVRQVEAIIDVNVLIRPLGRVFVKGRARSVSVFTLVDCIGLSDSEIEIMMSVVRLSEAALAQWSANHVHAAMTLAMDILALVPGDSFATALLERLQANTSLDW